MKQVNPFYKTKAWRTCRVEALRRDHYLCQMCMDKGLYTPADVVHHIEHLADRPDKALDIDNLQSVCHTCHNKLHPEKGYRKRRKKINKKARVITTKANTERW